MFDLTSYLARRQAQINTALENSIKADSKNAQLIQAMNYSLMAGGKRLRPILCLAATEALDGDPEHSMTAACALEMIHTYSLMHDDLPAMDDDDLRRGKPTCHVAFDEATAILTGDALLTMAFHILANGFLNERIGRMEDLEVIRTIAEAAGYHGMIEGQMRDMLSEGKQLTIEELKALHALKTGALIEASIRVGAILGNGSTAQIDQLENYAGHIGLAFQVRDDILNVEGDPNVMGKSVGTDHDRQKNTFPALLGLTESKRFAEELVMDALQSLNEFDNKADALRAIARYIIERKK